MNVETVPGNPRVFFVCLFFKSLLEGPSYALETSKLHKLEKTNFQRAVNIILGLVMEMMNVRQGF